MATNQVIKTTAELFGEKEEELPIKKIKTTAELFGETIQTRPQEPVMPRVEMPRTEMPKWWKPPTLAETPEEREAKARISQAEPKVAVSPFENLYGKKIGEPAFQFLYNLGNTLGFGLPEVALKKIPEKAYAKVGLEKETIFRPPETAVQQVAAGAGSLIGFIGGPAKVVGNVVAKLPMFAKKAKGILGIVQNIGKHMATLSVASGLIEHKGGTIPENVKNRFKALQHGAIIGSIFGAGQFIAITGKPLLSTVMRLGIGTATIDLATGVKPWDERELLEKVYHYGLNAWFLRHGKDPRLLLKAKKLEKEAADFTRQAKEEKIDIKLARPLEGRVAAIEAGFKGVERRAEPRLPISENLKEAYKRIAYKAPLEPKHKKALEEAGVTNKEIEKLRRFPEELPEVEVKPVIKKTEELKFKEAKPLEKLEPPKVEKVVPMAFKRGDAVEYEGEGLTGPKRGIISAVDKANDIVTIREADGVTLAYKGTEDLKLLKPLPEKALPKKIVEKRMKTHLGFPTDAPDIWYEVMEHGGIKRPKFEVEEFEGNVPKQLRRESGLKPDDMAARLGLEDTKQLYEKLERMQVERVAEKPPEAIRLEHEEFLAKQPGEKFLKTEEDILRKTGYETPEIGKFLDHEFLDGKELRATVNDVIAGKKTKAEAVAEIQGLIKSVTGKEPLEDLPIRMIPEKEITRGEEAGFVKIEVDKTFGGSKKSQVYQNIFDRFHSIKKLGDIVRKEGTELPPHKDPYIGIRNYLGVQGKAETKIFYKRFKVDWRGNISFKGESLKDILKPVKEKIDDFRRYLVERRVPELEGRGIETGRNVEEARKFVNAHAKEFEPQAKKFTEYMHSLLNDLYESGYLDKSTLEIIKANNQMYAPFQRVMEDLKEYGYVAASKNVLSKVTSPIKTIKGSKKQIIDPLESAIEATYRITEVVERNRIANQLIDLRKISPEIAKIIKPVRPDMTVTVLKDGTKVYRPLARQKEGIIEVLTEGKRHFWEVPKELYDSMAQLDKTGFDWVTKMLALPARVLRTGATTTPEFAFRNPVRDQWFAFVNAKYGYIPGWDLAKGLFTLIKKPELYWRWKSGGGEWSMLVTLDKATSQINMKRVLGARDYKRYLKNPISFLEDVSMLGEIPTRLGVFERAQGKVSDIEAAFQSREGSIDFARRGAKTKTISALYTFLNARLQGMEKLIRTARERPVETMAKITAVAVIPSVINYLLNRDDPHYWEIPQWQRDLFWIVPIRRGKGVMGKKPIYLRIPKGDVGVIFGTTTEKILESVDKDREGKIELDKLAVSIIKESMPISDIGGFLPVAARIPVELMANESFFYGRPIVSRGQERLEPKQQYSPFTSETSKAIGKAFNISPTKIDHLVVGYGAGLARYALKLNDGILAEMGVLPKKPDRPKELADYPVVRAFAVRDPMGFGSESVQNFYDKLDGLERFSATLKRLEERGKLNEKNQHIKIHWTKFLADKKGLITEFRRARTDLGALRKIRDKTLESRDLTAKQKESVMDDLNALVMAKIIPLLSKYRALEDMSKKK